MNATLNITTNILKPNLSNSTPLKVILSTSPTLMKANIIQTINGITAKMSIAQASPGLKVTINSGATILKPNLTTYPNTLIVKIGAKGDKGDPGALMFTAQNMEGVLIKMGSPVTGDAGGYGVRRTNATQTSKFCIGFANQDISPSVSGNILTAGVITIPDWTLIAGTPTLSPKAKYYLDTVDGKITTTPPNVAGQINQRVGFAIDSLTLSINIGYPIIL